MNNFVALIKERTGMYMEKSRFFNKNFTPKVVSIIFALVMWLYVMGEVNPESIQEWKNVRVELLNIEELRQSGLTIIGQTDFTVNVRVKGKRTELNKLTSNDMRVTADLRGFKKGVNSVPLEYSAPTNIIIEDISPKEIKVTFDEIVKRQKPVIVQTVGTTVEGYEPATAIVSPSEVIVEGPETLVNTVTMVVVDVNLSDRVEDINDKFPLKAVNQEGKEVIGVEVQTKLVEIIMPMFKIKEVPIALELLGNPQAGFKISNSLIDPSSVIIKGPGSIVDQISEIKATPISVEGVVETFTQDIVLELPEGITVPYLDKTPSITLTVEQILKREFTYSKDEIGIENLESRHKLDLREVPDNINVQIEAVESVIKDLKKEDILLYINVSGLREGKYSTKLLYNMPIIPDEIVITPSTIDFEIIFDAESNTG